MVKIDTPIDQKRGLSRGQAADYVGVGVSTFDMMVADHVMPAPIKYRGRLILSRTEVDRAFDDLSPISGPAENDDAKWG